MCSPPEVYVHALYDFDYELEEGKKISMREGEEFLLIKKTNDDWWQVIRDGDKRSFYAPANYLEEILQPGLNRLKRLLSSTSVDGGTTDKLKPNGGSLDATRSTPLVSSAHDLPSSSLVAENKKLMLLTVGPPPPLAKKPSPDVIKASNFASTTTKQLIVPNKCEPIVKSSLKREPSFSELTKDKSEKEKDNRFITEEQDKNRRNKENLQSGEITVQKNVGKPVVGKLVFIKPPQGRPPSPIYANFPLLTSPTPPAPKENEFPIRCLDSNWAEFEDSQGRKYYFNLATKEKSWKPPRRKSENSKTSSCRSSKESSPQPRLEKDVNLHSPTPESPFMPPGWVRDFDADSHEVCYVNDLTKERWFTSTDECGRIYYYEENAGQSFWQLPEVVIAEVDSGSRKKMTFLNASSSSLSDGRRSPNGSLSCSPPKSASPRTRPLSLAERGSRTRSMVLMDARFVVAEDRTELGNSRSSTLPRSLTSHHVTSIQMILKQDLLYKTKLSDGGKRIRKNWSTSFVLLTESALLFYKDGRSAQVRCNSPHSKPEFYVDLTGATVEWAPDKSSRKNVFQVNTVSGIQLLLQDENAQLCKGWFEAINKVISKLPSSGLELPTLLRDTPSPEESKRFRLTRTKSSKRIDTKGSGSSSTEELDSIPFEKKTKIRDKLKNFFLRRPTMESLREKGIFKEEPVFGSHLHTLCSAETDFVPRFVQNCIAAIEDRDMTADGLYRASGNLSQVQKIRYQVNQDNLEILKTEEDVHVLTGALKLFFRELKEPLFPFNTFESFLSSNGLPDVVNKLQAFRDLIRNLPRPNYNTLKYLLEHLLRVTKYSDLNRMHVHNLAIVFGPTLMWPATESANIALDMMHQNQIVEFLMLEFGSIFR